MKPRNFCPAIFDDCPEDEPDCLPTIEQTVSAIIDGGADYE